MILHRRILQIRISVKNAVIANAEDDGLWGTANLWVARTYLGGLWLND